MATMLDESRVVLDSASGQPTESRTAVLLHTQPIMLEVLEGVLEAVEITTISKHTSPAAALDAIRRYQPDAFVLDYPACEENPDGVGSIREAQQLAPALKTVVLADVCDERQVGAALAAGASVAVSRTAQKDDIASAVRQAFEPLIYFSSVAHLFPAPATRVADPGGELTRREREILQLVAEGRSNDQVARHLWVTVQTVKFHLSNIYRKLDVANRTEASWWAQRNGLMPDPQS